MIKLERQVYFLLLLVIPLQLGKHFWPQFSFVEGIRLDYLSPTFYLIDLLVLALFFLAVVRIGNKFFSIIKSYLFLLVLVIILLSTLFSFNLYASLFGLLKFLEFVFIGAYTSFVFTRKTIKLFFYAVSIGAVFEVILLFLQFYFQHSLNGPFYYFGERNFSPSSIGIALFQFKGFEVLRPYGTFPHPNVLGYYLWLVFVFVLFIGRRYLGKKLRNILLFILFTGILFTFSRILLLILLASLIYKLFSSKNRKKISLIMPGIFLLILVGSLYFSRFSTSLIKDTMLRIDLIKISFQIFLKNPLIGVGLNNFYYYEIAFQKTLTPVFLQPVHNIYLLIMAETGILGLFALLIYMHRIFTNLRQKMANKKLYSNFYKAVLVALAGSVFIGLFDHYLLTLEQGQILFSIVIGFSFARVKALM